MKNKRVPRVAKVSKLTNRSKKPSLFQLNPLKIAILMGLVLLVALGLDGYRTISNYGEELTINQISSTSGIPAFPGAEGFGAGAKGGRGGRVIAVTNLNDSGAGSLRQCAEVEQGPRTCIFRVAGTISLGSDIDIVNGNLTIAGQTAPGGGITLKASNPNSTAHMQVRAPDVIIRYLRSRPGTKEMNSRALSMNNPQNIVHDVMIDHNSFSWAGDELTITWLETNKVTYQWNIASESLPPGTKGPSFGEDGGGYFSVHHNLIAHHSQRLPQVSASIGPVDIVNNVIYNPGGNGSVVKNGTHANYVANYIKTGPNTTSNAYIEDGGAKGPATGYYVENNYIDGNIKLNTAINQVNTRYPAPPLTTTSPQAAYEEVLNKAGATHGVDCSGSWFPRRDSVDIRVVESVRARTRGHNGTGYITDPADVGGWPQLPAGTACADSDEDGMPDQWETAKFGNTSRGSKDNSSSDADGDGYTDLEEYMNGTDPGSATASTPAPTTNPSPTTSPTPTPTLLPSPTPSQSGSATPTPTAIASEKPRRSPRPAKSETPAPTTTSAAVSEDSDKGPKTQGKSADANQDGSVNRTDFWIWYANYGKNTNQGIRAGDFDRSGKVEIQDLTVWLNAVY